MITRDFILREIQQLAAVLARVFMLRGTGQREEVLEEIRIGLSNTHLESALHDSITREDVIGLCTTESGFSFEKAMALGDLLRERGYAQKELEKEGWGYSLLHALWLYEHINMLPNSTQPLDMHDRILSLRSELAESSEVN